MWTTRRQAGLDATGKVVTRIGSARKKRAIGKEKIAGRARSHWAEGKRKKGNRKEKPMRWWKPRDLFAFRGSKWMGSCSICHQEARGCVLTDLLVPITGQGFGEPSVSSYGARREQIAVSKGYRRPGGISTSFGTVAPLLLITCAGPSPIRTILL